MAMGGLMAAAVVRCKERMQMGLVEKGNKKEGSGDYLGLAHIAGRAVDVDVAVKKNKKFFEPKKEGQIARST